jgi:multidrug efflux system membrane fusion protein
MAVLLAVCAALSGCSSGSSSAESKQGRAQASSHAASVAVAKVEKQDVPVYLVGLGSVTAFYTANIKSRVDGQIMRVNFQEGQLVKEGDLLILIDPRPYQVQLEQMQAQIFKDQASLRDAKLNLDRYNTILPSGSIAQQQVDTQKSTVDQLDYGRVYRTRGPPAGGSGKYCACGRYHPDADPYATAADWSDFHASRG